MKKSGKKDLKISDEAYSNIHQFGFELSSNLDKWLKFYKKNPLLKTCLKLLDRYDKELQAKYTIKKESYWDKF